MTATALGVDRAPGYPRALVEPLLWLALLTGATWLLVTVDAHGNTATGSASVASGIPQLASALALVLLLNSAAALLLASQGGNVARGLATLAGVGLVAAGWGFHLVIEIDPQVRTWMTWGCITAGISLAVLSRLHWREPEAKRRNPEHSTLELLMLAGLLAAAGVVVFGVFELRDSGLVGLEYSDQSAWDELVPSMLALTGLLAGAGQAWHRRWWAALATVAVGGALARITLLAVS